MSTFYAEGYQDGEKGLRASPPSPYTFAGNNTSVFAAEYLAGWVAGRAAHKEINRAHQ